jgi:hypothetical protein
MERKNILTSTNAISFIRCWLTNFSYPDQKFPIAQTLWADHLLWIILKNFIYNRVNQPRQFALWQAFWSQGIHL